MNAINEYNKKSVDSFTPEFLKLPIEEQIKILQSMLATLDKIGNTLNKSNNDKVS